MQEVYHILYLVFGAILNSGSAKGTIVPREGLIIG